MGYHGHHALLDWLRKIPDQKLSGKVLLEIGAMRATDSILESGCSTFQLAHFCHKKKMHFITVDVDPANVGNMKRMLEPINPTFQAYLMKGEDLTQSYHGSVDFVYLDAFDIDHEFHDKSRKRFYRKHLGTEITNEACDQMHLSCVENLIDRSDGDRQPKIFCFDDTWYELSQKDKLDQNGNRIVRYFGKGASSVPLLQENGYMVMRSSYYVMCFSP